MITYLRRLVDERNSLTGLIQTTMERAAAEERDLSDTERTTITAQQERCAALDTQVNEHQAQAESARAWANLQERLAIADTRDGEHDRTPVRRASADDGPVSWGQRFVDSAQFRSYEGHGSSGRVEVPGVFEMRAPITTSFFPVPPAPFTPTNWVMTTPLLDAVGKQRVSTGVVEWVTWGGAYPLAAVVPEGTAKPEAVITPTPHTESLETYAHWAAITRQALEDLPRIQSIVETQLRGGLLRKIEADTAAALTAETGFTEVTNPDLIAGIRIAIGTVQDAGYANPSTVVLNPADWAEIDLAVMGNANLTPVSQSGVWGVRIVAASAIPAGTAYVGALDTAVTLFDRGVSNVFVSDSHSDYFVKNILLVLAETRGLPVVTEPLAAVRVIQGTVTP